MDGALMRPAHATRSRSRRRGGLAGREDEATSARASGFARRWFWDEALHWARSLPGVADVRPGSDTARVGLVGGGHK